jgi:hypothetical protein
MCIPASAASPVTAKPAASTVRVNGKAVEFQAYNISDYNYFKLRDLAAALNGSAKQFQVVWSGGNIYLYPNTAYTAVGGELAKAADTGAVTAYPSISSVYCNGQLLNLTVFTIGNNNYFKLRDIASVINFFVGWDGDSNTITIDTSRQYEAEESTTQAGELGPEDYYMVTMYSALPGAAMNPARTHLIYSIPETNSKIDVVKYALNNYIIQLSTSQASLSTDLTYVTKLLTAFVPDPSAVVTKLSGLSSNQSAVVKVDIFSFQCTNAGYYTINVTW